jgi:glutamate-ammonia-ligase adenylyltransferase
VNFPSRPLAADRRAAKRKLDGWLDLADEPGRRALGADADAIAAVFDGSPFLHDLAMRDSARFARVLASEPGAALDDVVARAASLDPASADDELMRALRLLRQEAALVVALADLCGLWTLAEVTGGLTRFADAAIAAALRAALAREVARGRLRPEDPSAPERGSGFFVLGMGKLGAGELNFSSDIDLICFYEAGKATLRDPDEHQAVFVRVAQTMAKLLNERTFDGVAFRVDLRLRPDPGTYPVAISTALALHYYEALGQTWERAAFIKARPVAGDIAEGQRFLAELRPFVFRKYLDFASIAEVHAMKRQIHAVKGHERIAVAGHDLKLGRGGIREIEFFVQTQQLIGGGRDARLRDPRTLASLDALSEAGWIGEAASRELHEAYVSLRGLEHRAQMVADAQTHRIPEGEDELFAFARFCGVPRRDVFAKRLSDVLRVVEGHYARLFEEAADARAGERLVFAGEGFDARTKTALAGWGFSDPEAVIGTVRSWLAGKLPATRSPAARERLAELLPRLFEAMSGTGEPDAALVGFDRCLARLPAGLQFFALLRSNPNLLDLIAAILGSAPAMTEVLGRRPRVLDGLIEALHRPPAETADAIEARVASLLGEAREFEDALDRARVLAQEQRFLIGVRLLGGALPADRAGPAFSAVAGAVVRDLHRRVARVIEARHGRPERGVSAVVALGKLGSGEMTAASDLDLLVLYDDAFDAMSDGERPLYASEYYTRLTQRLVAALSSPTAQGTAYAVDFRLRPSGNKGPLATSFEAFRGYHESEAWTWEHMALARARVVSGPPDFAAKVEAEIDRIVRRPRKAKRVTADILDMRRLVAEEKPPANDWDVKLAKGGQIDLEFLAQWLTLVHASVKPELHARGAAPTFGAAARCGVLNAGDAEALIAASRLYDAVTQVLRLALDGPFEPSAASKGLAAMLARAAQAPDLRALEAELAATRERVAAIAKRLWGAAPWPEG